MKMKIKNNKKNNNRKKKNLNQMKNVQFAKL